MKPVLRVIDTRPTTPIGLVRPRHLCPYCSLETRKPYHFACKRQAEYAAGSAARKEERELGKQIGLALWGSV